MISFGALLQCDVSAGWWRVGLDTRRVLESEMKYASSGIWMLIGPEPSWSNSMLSFRFQLEIVREWKEDKTKKKKIKLFQSGTDSGKVEIFLLLFDNSRAACWSRTSNCSKRKSRKFSFLLYEGGIRLAGNVDVEHELQLRAHTQHRLYRCFCCCCWFVQSFFCREISCPSLEGRVEVKSEQSTRN